MMYCLIPYQPFLLLIVDNMDSFQEILTYTVSMLTSLDNRKKYTILEAG
jgi:hypothetical protein